MVGKQIIIWLDGGQTLKFVGVKNVTIHANELTFEYHGVSTGVSSKARFKVDKLLGWAQSVYEYKWTDGGMAYDPQIGGK